LICLDRIFPEPLLEFGGGGTSSDIRYGLLRFGPVDAGTAKAKDVVRLGFVGTPKTIAAFSTWMQQCGAGVPGDDPLNPNFAPRFPGLDPKVGFRCRFATDPSWVAEVTDNELKVEAKQAGAVTKLADFFHLRIKALFELSAARPDVAICLPPDLVRKVVKPRTFSDDDEEDSGTNGRSGASR